MNKIRKNIIVYSNSFFFDADSILTINAKSYYTTSDLLAHPMRFLFDSKTKKVHLIRPQADYNSLSVCELNIHYEITYYSIKHERKLKLEKLKELNEN